MTIMFWMSIYYLMMDRKKKAKRLPRQSSIWDLAQLQHHVPHHPVEKNLHHLTVVWESNPLSSIIRHTLDLSLPLADEVQADLGRRVLS